jgi:hypothetical protein
VLGNLKTASYFLNNGKIELSIELGDRFDGHVEFFRKLCISLAIIPYGDPAKHLRIDPQKNIE